MAEPIAGFDNDGRIVVKNRWYRRKRRSIAQLDGLPKNFYTTSQVKWRKKKNGKKVKVNKKHC